MLRVQSERERERKIERERERGGGGDGAHLLPSLPAPSVAAGCRVQGVGCRVKGAVSRVQGQCVCVCVCECVGESGGLTRSPRSQRRERRPRQGARLPAARRCYLRRPSNNVSEPEMWHRL